MPGAMDLDADFGWDADEAVRLVSGMLRRGEAGEVFRERRHVAAWSVTEAGLLAPQVSEERGTAARIRRDGQLLLVCRSGDGPDSLRETVREAARRAGGAPFFKAHRATTRSERDAPADDASAEEARAGALAAAVARALPDPRGLSVSLVVARVTVQRAVITSRAFLGCGGSTRLEARGTIRRAGSERGFSFQSSRPWTAATEALALALHEAARPVPHLSPPPGTVDVVLAPAAAAVFWHEVVGHALEADCGDRGSVLARVKGAAVAPAGIDVVDDPSRTDLPGSYVVDDEGTVARTVPLLSDGTVTGLLTDRRSPERGSNGHARVSDYRRPPRPRMSNLVTTAGTATLDALVERCGNGLLVRDVAAGSADPESGRFTLVVERAETIRRGRRTGAVSGFALTGDTLAALEGIDEEWGRDVLPASGLSLCVKGGDALPVGGAAAAIVVRGLTVRAARR